MKNTIEYPVDIVIPWVDSMDPEWLAEKKKYDTSVSLTSNIDSSESRYRENGTLKYLLRSIDVFMPWVNTIHFVTWGHIPYWMNVNAPGLNVVKHTDFIPGEYLPTFSSHTIELNLFRIPDLADHFVYFNDDMLLLQPIQKNDFFVDGLPVDYAIETALIGKRFQSIAGVSLSNAEIINQHFSKHKVIKSNLFKWFNYRYGMNMFKTFLLLPWSYFSDFSYSHTANPFLKSTFKTVWDKEYGVLDATCKSKFRKMNDVNQWIMRDWQLASGNFIPGTPSKGKTFNITNDLSSIRKAISESKFKMICINDVNYENITDYNLVIEELDSILSSFLSKPSRFERDNI